MAGKSPGVKIIETAREIDSETEITEQGETVETRAELQTLCASLFARPYRLGWKWDRRRATCQDNLAWIVAEGRIEMTHPDRVEHLPYRMIGVLQQIGGEWRWRLFSGSEPASAR